MYMFVTIYVDNVYTHLGFTIIVVQFVTLYETVLTILCTVYQLNSNCLFYKFY